MRVRIRFGWPMRTKNIYVVVDGEVRAVSIDFSKDSEVIEVYLTSILDKQVKTWTEYRNIYGDTYYKSLRGYKSGRKYKISDLINGL